MMQIRNQKRLNSLLIFSRRLCAGDRRILWLRMILEDLASLEARSALQAVGNDADESKSWYFVSHRSGQVRGDARSVQERCERSGMRSL